MRSFSCVHCFYSQHKGIFWRKKKTAKWRVPGQIYRTLISKSTVFVCSPILTYKSSKLKCRLDKVVCKERHVISGVVPCERKSYQDN